MKYSSQSSLWSLQSFVIDRSLSKCLAITPCRFISVAFPFLPSSKFVIYFPFAFITIPIMAMATHCADFAAGRQRQRSRFLPQGKPAIIRFSRDLMRAFLSAQTELVLMDIRHRFFTIPSADYFRGRPQVLAVPRSGISLCRSCGKPAATLRPEDLPT
jgi:hypothetical protein